MRYFAVVGIALGSSVAASPAFAQANANAVVRAGDAFGFRSGDESVGIYDESSVRGFNLEAAGNYRLNGTYFVRNSGVNSFFVESTTIRIGYNTLSSILPGPSGVVDYRIRDPKPKEPSLFTAGLDVFAQPYAELHLKGAGSDLRSSYSLGVGRVFQVRDLQGGSGGSTLTLGGAARLTRGAVVGQAFAGAFAFTTPGQYRISASPSALPPRIERGRFLGQEWADNEGVRLVAGVLADTQLSPQVGVGATIVAAKGDIERSFTQLFSDIRTDGTVRSVIFANRDQAQGTRSAELRAHYAPRASGKLSHRFDLSLRYRKSTARFGGTRSIDLGRSEFGEPTVEIPEPALTGATSNLNDKVDQWGLGLTYRGEFGKVLSVNLGALRTAYRKTFTPVTGAPRRERALPLLYNAGLAWRALDKVEVYGSYARGLEESGVAPATASNRNEVLPAILVTQRELGLRYTPSERIAMVVGAFETRKPYTGIDPTDNAFRLIGQVRHRGIEASFSGRVAEGMSVVVGGVLLDPKLSGDAVRTGRFGDRPVAVPRIRSIASIDYAVRGVPGLSVDAGAIYVGSRPARSVLGPAGEQLKVGAIPTLNLGLRYRTRLFRHELIVRGQLFNTFNQYSWDVNSSETLVYTAPRRARIVLTTTF